MSGIHTHLGDFNAARLHTEAVATDHFLRNVETGIAADLANGYSNPLTDTEPEVFDIFRAKCACKACESAVSPLAYLADLLDYTVTHLRKKVADDQTEAIMLDFLTEQFHQPFGELRASCQTVEEELRQVRICVEVLRSFLGPRPLANLDKEQALVHAEAEYRLAAYRVLLGAIGTTFDELRLAKTAELDIRTQLANRLAIAVEHLKELLLDPKSMTEQDLERLFGLADTTRDPLSRGAKLGDTDEQFSRWSFKGIEWNSNTDRDGRIYLSLKSPTTGVFRVDVHRDQNQTELIASGESASATGTVVLSQEEESSLSGIVEINFVADTEAVEVCVVPEYLSWRLDFLRSLWFKQDWPFPLPPQPDTIPDDADPLIEPDLIGPGDLTYIGEDEPAFKRWQERRQQVGELLAATKAERESDGLPDVIQSRVGTSLTNLRQLREQLQAGEDIEAQLKEIRLPLPAFLRLLEIAEVLESGETVLDSELEEIDSILTQAQKLALFKTWIAEEVADGIALSPDHFRVALEESEELPLFRATREQRREWQNRLRARIDEEQAAIERLRLAVDGTEEATLTMLRDALVVATDAEGTNLDVRAERLTRKLLIDAKNNGCPRTTRTAQAVETTQELLWSTRTGVLRNFQPDIQLDADNFYEEWEWLGSYETWRAAMFVFLYPENILLPSLRNRQTPGFRRLVQELRNQNRLTPEQACYAAREYADYFGDVCSMKVEASCQADTRIHRGEGCRERTAAEYRYLAYHFGRGAVTPTVYWTTFDLQERCGDAQSYWKPVPGLQNVDTVIGAVPYRISDDERYICLFVRGLEDGAQKLKLTRYNLEEERWDDEPVDLDLPEGAQPRFTAVIGQRITESGPPRLAIRGAGGAIYSRGLNRDATGWGDDDAKDHAESDGEWRILISRSKGREFKRLWAMVEMKDTSNFYLLVQDREGHIRCRFFGAKDDGYWYPDPQSNNPSEVERAREWKGEPVGAFHFPFNQLYVVWKKTSQPKVAFFTISDFQPEIAVGQTTITYYQRITSPAATRTREIESFQELDQWLIDVAGLSLKYQAVSFEDHPSINLLDLFTSNPGDIPKYKKKVRDVIDALEGQISGGNMGQDWSVADVLVRRLTNKDSIAAVLRTLFDNRDSGNATAVKFDQRTDTFSELFHFSAGLDHIAPVVTAERTSGPVDQRLATQYRGGQVGAYQSQFGGGGSGQLREIVRDRLIPRCSGPMEITERLSDEQRALRGTLIKKAFLENADGPPSHLTYLEEAYYFVPVHLALQLQRRGQYLAALDWFRTVLDCGMPEDERKIYFGLVQEEDLSEVYKRARNWLGDPLNPHAIAETRGNTYTRFTILSLVRCLLEFGDAEFTRDTAESVVRARSLYLTALDLLDMAVIRQNLSPCGTAIEELNTDVGPTIALEAPEWKSIWDEIFLALGRIDNRKALETAISDIKAVLNTDDALEERLIKAQKIVAEVLNSLPPRPILAQVLSRKSRTTATVRPSIFSSGSLFSATKQVGNCAGNDVLVAVATATAFSTNELRENSELPLPWLRQPMTASATVAVVDTPVNPATTGGRGDGRLVPFNPIAPSRFARVGEAFRAAPLHATKLVKKVGLPFVPSTYSDFCVSPNPVIASLRLHAELNLFKIRTCRNIAGDERALEPYAAPIDVETGLPTIGSGGQIVLPATLVFRPTPFRYSVLIERAKQLVSLAQQIEAAFLSALEKRDAEFFQLLRARQEVRLAHAGVRLQELRVKEAEDGVTLAKLQRERAQIQVDHFNGLISGGLLQLERDALIALSASLIVPDSVTFSAGFPSGLSSTTTYSPSGKLQTLANISSTLASFERRKEEWIFQRDLARQDARIGDQQVKIARDHVRVVGQDRLIAEMQADHAETAAEFLANKFTNAELFDWMSQILEGVYSFFLQQATALARLAENQLAFERQEVPPAIVQADYWEAPLGLDIGGVTDGTASDRRGLTGSARLLQDIFKLDQHAFETDKRKLQLTKTMSLASLAPAEFQRFRESGIMRFATPMALFDHDFPGHFLRLIKRVRISVIALIPPTEGIKAALSATGISRVVINSGAAFQTTEVRRAPESVALTSPINATGLFELTPQPQEKLFPFESIGVDTAWEFRMPKAANFFDYNTIADVLLTIEYTALDSFDYRRQVVQELDQTISADRPFSFRHEFADQFYDLNNPDQTDTPMTVVFRTRREDFPPNIDDLTTQQVVLFFSRADDFSDEVQVNNLKFTFKENGNEISVDGGAATSIEGIISTRRGNAGNWTKTRGKPPMGEWELALPNTDAMKSLFKEEKIQDILFVITYSGQTPEWPG